MPIISDFVIQDYHQTPIISNSVHCQPPNSLHHKTVRPPDIVRSAQPAFMTKPIPSSIPSMAEKPCAHFSTHGCTTVVAKEGDLCTNCQTGDC